MILKLFTTTMLMKFLKTDGAKVFILRVLKTLAERSETPFDDDLVRIVGEMMEGDTSSVKIKKRR